LWLMTIFVALSAGSQRIEIAMAFVDTLPISVSGLRSENNHSSPLTSSVQNLPSIARLKFHLLKGQPPHLLY
jgi:hypothetical protein